MNKVLHDTFCFQATSNILFTLKNMSKWSEREEKARCVLRLKNPFDQCWLDYLNLQMDKNLMKNSFMCWGIALPIHEIFKPYFTPDGKTLWRLFMCPGIAFSPWNFKWVSLFEYADGKEILWRILVSRNCIFFIRFLSNGFTLWICRLEKKSHQEEEFTCVDWAIAIFFSSRLAKWFQQP